MERSEKRKSPRLQGYDYSSPGAYFVTVCTKDKRCILSTVVGTGVLDCPRIKLTQFGMVADRYIGQMNAFYDHISVDSYIIMPNHIHMLLTLREKGQSGTPVPTTRANTPLSQFISTFKRFCNREYGENIWQDRWYDHIIRNQEDYDEHLKYIYENPIRWIAKSM